MNILEREIEDIVFAAINGECETSMLDHGIELQDVTTPREHFRAMRQLRINSAGVADIVTIGVEWSSPIDVDITVEVIELKRGKIGYHELGQICRYIQAVNRTLRMLKMARRRNESGVSVEFSVRGVLIGSEVENNNDFVFLFGCIRDVKIYTYSLDFDNGIMFEYISSDWSVSGEKLLDGELPGLLSDAYSAAIESIKSNSVPAQTGDDVSDAAVDNEGNIVVPERSGGQDE